MITDHRSVTGNMMAELYKYTTSLRSITQGKASFSTKFAEYTSVPMDIQQKLMKEMQDNEAE